ncbi:MAG: HEAT repeat domain-containing protein [Firmicutes bacterium]|nr:HEAT repeat domain-containing protein [Bacillota bacterium]
MQNVSCKLISDKIIAFAIFSFYMAFFLFIAENTLYLDSWMSEKNLKNDDELHQIDVKVRKAEQLIVGLKSRNPKERWNAAANLGILRSEVAVPDLIYSLKNDNNPQVRMLSAWALGRIKSPEAVFALTNALEDRNLDVRTLAIWSIGELRLERGAHPLEMMVLSCRETGTLQTLMEALAKIKSPASVRALASQMKNPDPFIRECVSSKLRYFRNEDSAKILLTALDDDESNVVCQAIISLREMNYPGLKNYMDKFLKSHVPRVRHEAEVTLAVLDNNEMPKPADFDVTRAKEQFFTFLNQYSRPDLDLGDITGMNPEDSQDLGTLPIQLGRRFDLTEACRDMKSEYSDFRSDAAWRMGNSGQKEVVPYLIEALNDSDYNVRWNAAKALGKIMDQRAVEPLIAKMDDPEKDVREDVVEALGRLKDPRAVKVLAKSLKTEPEGYVRAEIIVAIQLTGGSVRYRNLLVESLGDRSPPVRANAALAIGCGSNQDCKPLLEKLLSDDSHDVKEAAKRAIDALSGGKKIDIIDHYHED